MDNQPVTKADLQAAVEKITQQIRIFSEGQSALAARIKKLEADVSAINNFNSQRLGLVEDRATRLELRLIALEGRPPVRAA